VVGEDGEGDRERIMATLKIISKLIKIWLVGIVIGAVLIILLTKVFHVPTKTIIKNPVLGYGENL